MASRSVVALGIALGVAACQGSESGVSESFALATATSWSDAGWIETELRDAEGDVVATAQWEVASQRGVVTVAGRSLTTELTTAFELTEAAANALTYELWLASDPELVTAYDTLPSCSAWEYYEGCWYRSCAACVTWGGWERCAVIGQSDCSGY